MQTTNVRESSYELGYGGIYTPCGHAVLKITESSNFTMVWVGRDLNTHLIPLPFH